MKKDPLFVFLSGDSDSISDKIYRRTSAFKNYKRFPTVMLPAPEDVTMNISDALRRRRTIREYRDTPLSQKHISNILFWSAGLFEKGDEKQWRAHPSGGALFPIELYPIILRGENISRGVYHYNIEKHTLEHITTADVDTTVRGFGRYSEIIAQSGMAVVLSFVKKRSMGKYKEFAYKLAFLEGGHIGQNLSMLSSAYDLGSCNFGMRKIYAPLNEAIGLDGINETTFYAISIGHKKAQ